MRNVSFREGIELEKKMKTPQHNQVLQVVTSLGGHKVQGIRAEKLFHPHLRVHKRRNFEEAGFLA